MFHYGTVLRETFFMIDISIYKQRLEDLRQRLIHRIDGYIWIDFNSIPKMSPEKIFKLFKETGVIWLQKQ